jgi:hypothetical protein
LYNQGISEIHHCVKAPKHFLTNYKSQKTIIKIIKYVLLPNSDVFVNQAEYFFTRNFVSDKMAISLCSSYICMLLEDKHAFYETSLSTFLTCLPAAIKLTSYFALLQYFT